MTDTDDQKEQEQERKRMSKIESDMRQLSVLVMAASIIGIFFEPVTPWAGAAVVLALSIWSWAIWKLKV